MYIFHYNIFIQHFQIHMGKIPDCMYTKAYQLICHKIGRASCRERV